MIAVGVGDQYRGDIFEPHVRGVRFEPSGERPGPDAEIDADVPGRKVAAMKRQDGEIATGAARDDSELGIDHARGVTFLDHGVSAACEALFLTSVFRPRIVQMERVDFVRKRRYSSAMGWPACS